MPHVRLDGTAISDWSSFHAEWKRVLGFPDFYGANMDAWIDCMSSLRDPEAGGMATVVLGPDEVLTVEVTHAELLRERLPGAIEELWECTAFVNRRYVDWGGSSAIALAPLDSRPSRPAT